MVCLHNDSEWGMARLRRKKSLTATYAKQILMRVQNSIAHTHTGSRLTVYIFMYMEERERVCGKRVVFGANRANQKETDKKNILDWHDVFIYYIRFSLRLPTIKRGGKMK